ncbi:transglutaminase-like domain-containing protein [Amphibiibacter pelophylacis]|uniref:Transglutaminase family protein n=1 Tax=Amphibiibacter pelophylacis TaxID=1799477 RepID=A0ACC6P1F3_9BURK
MKRRHFLNLSAAPLLGSAFLTGLPSRVWASPAPDAAPATAGSAWKRHEITTHVDLSQHVGADRVWVPLPAQQLSDARGDYQRVEDIQFDAPGASQAKILTATDGTRLLAAEWADDKAPRQLTVTTRVALRDRAIDLSAAPTLAKASAEELAPWLRATQNKPLDGIVGDTARGIVARANARTDVEKAKAIYDWIVTYTERKASVRGCGSGDAEALLTIGNLGGKCADLNGLFVALSRATGVPARDVYGIRVDDSALGYKSLGKSGDITRAQHCRAEFYAQGYGWVPVDPADVRKVMLEEPPGNLPADNPRVVDARRRLFGAWEMNWMGYNQAEDLRLPGSQLDIPLAFLMYPQGETAQRRLNSYDPATFVYAIQSQRMA